MDKADIANIASQLKEKRKYIISHIDTIIETIRKDGLPNNAKTAMILINKGTIGVLNTGYVDKIENSISQLQHNGANDIAESVKKVKDAVLLSEELDDQTKEEVFERLAEISEQANLPAENRKGKSILKDIFNGISTTLNSVGSLASIWGTWGANISNFLNF